MRFFLILFSFTVFSADFDGYIVKLKNQKSAKSFKSQFAGDTKNLNLSFGTYLVWKPTTKSIDETALENLKNNPDVLYVEPNYLLKEIGVTKEGPEVISDEFFSKQWSLENTGNNSTRSGYGRAQKGVDIKAKEAWKITKGSSEIVIGVMDSGILYTHPDLAQNMWKNEKELNGVAGVDDDGNGYIDDIYGFVSPANKNQNPSDMTGHGTHTAGTIAMAHNSIGGRGVMAHVKLMPLKLQNDRNFEFPMENILMAFDYAIKMGVNIITTSIGGDKYSKAFEDAIRLAGSKGIPFICACGNSSDNLDKKKVYPPSYADNIDTMIVVCSHGDSGKKDPLSNYGQKTAHILAPGLNIRSTSTSVMPNSSGFKDPIYMEMSGTSMAAPHVAGAVGLLLSIEPNLTPKEIRDRIVRTAKKDESLSKFSLSGGRLDLYRLLSDIEN